MAEIEIRNQALLGAISIGRRDPDSKRIEWSAPNNGKYPVAHVDTFMSRYSSLAGVYRNPDEAMMDSHENARNMLNDVGIRECLDSRKRSVAQLNWHIAADNDSSADQKEFCSMLEKIVNRIKNFTMYRYVCQDAIWYGKYGIQHRWGTQVVDNKSVWMPTPRHQDDMGWQPLNGDKLVFRQRRAEGQRLPGEYEGQVGIRVGWGRMEGDMINGRWRVEQANYGKLQPTDYGLAYFLSPAERRLLLIHKHNITDADYEDGLRAGLLYGEGIRSVVYWEWFQKQQTMEYLMQYLGRMAGGIQIWRYPAGNAQAEAETKNAAENFNGEEQHIMLVPVPVGDQGQYGVEVIDPGFQGIDTLHDLLTSFFNHRIKRYILGQILSSESEATGLGSGVAELHQDTLLQILKSDATNQGETLTSDLLGSIIKINVQKGVWADPGFIPKFVIETEESDVDSKLQAVIQLMDRGVPFRLPDIYEMVGMAEPQPGDATTEANPQGQGGDGQGGQGGPEAFGPPKPGAEDAGDDSQESAAAHGEAREPNETPKEKPDSVHRYARVLASPFKRSTATKGVKFRK